MENETDILFKKGLGEYRKAPPAHLWNEIAAKVIPSAKPLVKKSRRTGKIMLWLISSLLFFIGLLFIWLYLLKELPVTTKPEIASAPVKNTISEYSTEPVIAEAGEEIIFNDEPKELLINSNDGDNRIKTFKKASGGNQVISKPLAVKNNQNTVYQIEYKPEVESVATEKPLEPEYIPDHSKQISTEEKEVIKVTEQSNELHVNAPEIQIPEKRETKGEVTEEENKEENRQKEPDATEPDYSKSSVTEQRRKIDFIHGIRYSIGLQAGLQYYNAARPLPAKMQYSPEGTLILRSHYQRYSITTGVGMISFTHKNPWNALLLKTDTTGLYPYVTGVDFMPVYNPIDSTIAGYTASGMITATKPVIDTTLVITSGNNDYRITYLSVPLLAGYEILHYRKVSFTAQSGIIYNRMIYDRESPPVIPDKGELLEISKEAVVTNKRFWQYQAGINVRYEPNLNWYAEGSASFRKPIDRWYYKTDSNVKPSLWVIGAAIGLYL